MLLGNERPAIVVDWSDFEVGRQWLMLEAAVPVGRRAISLYERVFFFIGRELLKGLDDLPQPVIEFSVLTLRHHISSATPAPA